MWFQLIIPKKLVRKGAFWHFAKFKTTSINVVINGAFEIIDCSRESLKDPLKWFLGKTVSLDRIIGILHLATRLSGFYFPSGELNKERTFTLYRLKKPTRITRVIFDKPTPSG
jgi:hypothetical protein